MLADIAAQQCDLDAIRHYASMAQPLAERDNHQLYLAIIDRVMGVAHRLAGEYDAANERLTQALKIFNALGTRWQIARTLAEFGALEEARRNQAAAREYYSRALKDFDGLRAEPDIARIATRLG